MQTPDRGRKEKAAVTLGRIIGGEAMLRTNSLRDHEREFVQQIVEKFKAGQSVSTKQQEWFGKLYKRTIGWWSE
jgi:hypothetical protein